MTADSKHWYLSTVPALQALPEATLRSLADAANLREHPRRVTLYISGDIAEHVYFIHGGRVSVLLESTASRTINLGDFGPGDVVGEGCLWTSDPHKNMAVTTSATLLSIIPRDVLRRVFDKHPAAEQALFARSFASHQATTRRLCDAHTLGIRARLARQLLQLGEHGRDTPLGREIACPPRQRELAALIASTRESVSLALRRLERERLITRRGRRIFLDLPQLHAAAREDSTLQRSAPPVRSRLNTSIHGAPPH